MSGRGAHTKNIPKHPIVLFHPYNENTIVNTTTTMFLGGGTTKGCWGATPLDSWSHGAPLHGLRTDFLHCASKAPLQVLFSICNWFLLWILSCHEKLQVNKSTSFYEFQLKLLDLLRSCGRVFCGKCSPNQVPLPRYGMDKPVRVCNRCYIYYM